MNNQFALIKTIFLLVIITAFVAGSVMTGSMAYAKGKSTDSITIASLPIEITTTSLDPIVVGSPFNQTITTSNGEGTQEWSIFDGALPIALSLNSTSGEITGTPTTLGAFNFTVQVIDLSGNDTQVYTGTVLSSFPLVLTPPSSKSINTDTGVCNATSPNIGTAITSGGVAPITISDNRPNPFPLGLTTVTWNATDSSTPTNQTDSKIQNVTVVDNQYPTITAPANMTIISATPVSPSLGTPSVSDNCPGVTYSNNAPGVFPLGTTLVTWNATDVAGHISNDIQKVTINSPSTTINELITFAHDNNVKTSPINNAEKILNDKNKSNDKSVCGKLTAFANQIKASKKMDLTLKGSLLLKTNAIKTSLGC